MDKDVFTPLGADEGQTDRGHVGVNGEAVRSWRQNIAHVPIHAFYTLAVDFCEAWGGSTYTKASIYGAQTHVRPRVTKLFNSGILYVCHNFSPSFVSRYPYSPLPIAPHSSH